MRICPKCRAFYGDPQLAFCLADGTPLANVNPQSEKFKEGSRAVEEQAKRLSKQRRRVRWRKIVLASLTTLVMAMVVTTSFTVETTTPTQPESSSSLPSPDPHPSLTPTESLTPSSLPSPTPSPSPSISPTPTPTPIPVYKITGVVTTTGQPLGGVAVQLSGAKTDTTKTDPNGRYAFNDLRADGNYLVTPVHVQITFAPASRSFNSLNKNELADFPAAVFRISGRVTSLAGPLRRVKISLEGSKATSMETDDNGYYAFTDLRAGGSYTVSLSAARIQPPTSRFFGNLRRDESADFHQSDATPPPPECLERNMNREAEEVFRGSSSHLRETIDKDERERAAIHDKYGEGVKNVELSVGPLQPERIRFLEPCKVFVVTAGYSWQVAFPGNAIAPPRTKKVQKTKDFTCEKRKDGWQCR